MLYSHSWTKVHAMDALYNALWHPVIKECDTQICNRFIFKKNKKKINVVVTILWLD